MANKPNDENQKELTKEEIRAKEKRYFKKIICPNCFSEIETASKPCPICAEKRNSLN